MFNIIILVFLLYLDFQFYTKFWTGPNANNAQDLLAVYTNIAGGSYNHLRGFLQALKNEGYDLPDVSEVLPSGVTVDQLLQLK
jgi:hypothetical protein